jgi:hypothetical protein
MTSKPFRWFVLALVEAKSEPWAAAAVVARGVDTNLALFAVSIPIALTRDWAHLRALGGAGESVLGQG